MGNINKFHPGSYLKDFMITSNMTIKELSIRTGISEMIISNLIDEKISINLDIANKLSKLMDSSTSLWMNLQKEYDLALQKEE